MNILIDIGHPAHVHLFKNTIQELKSHGHKLFFSVRDIPIAKRLMQIYGMAPYQDLGKKKDSIIGKAITVVQQDLMLLKYIKQNDINIGISSGIVLSHLSTVMNVASIVCDDDDDDAEKWVVKYGHPMTDVVLTPKCISRKTAHALYYDGTHELAYLHPNRFTPDSSVLHKAGLTTDSIFFIMRFVAFKGHHDINQSGLSIEQKRRLLKLLAPYGRVIITSERAIEPEFEEYRLPVPPEEIHSLMAYSSMFIGDSQTMTSEAAILGIPSFKCNTFAGRLSVPNEIEGKYGLCYSYQPSDFEAFYSHIQRTLLNLEGAKEEWKIKKEKFLADKIDVTAFFTWFIENYPESKRIMTENPDYQYKFK